MSFILRQSVKQSTIHLVGVAIGALSILFIYPRDLEIYGLCRFFIDTSIFLAPLLALGGDSLAVRYFPVFENGKKHHGFLSILLSLLGLGAILAVLVYYPFLSRIFSNYFVEKDPLLKGQLGLLLPMAILFSLTQLLYQYTSNFKQIAIPYLFFNFIRKLFVPIIVVLYIIDQVEVDGVVWGLLMMFLIGAGGIIYYLKQIGQWRIGKIENVFFLSTS